MRESGGVFFVPLASTQLVWVPLTNTDSDARDILKITDKYEANTRNIKDVSKTKKENHRGVFLLFTLVTTLYLTAMMK